jgi:hypothetical protein
MARVAVTHSTRSWLREFDAAIAAAATQPGRAPRHRKAQLPGGEEELDVELVARANLAKSRNLALRWHAAQD